MMKFGVKEIKKGEFYKTKKSIGFFEASRNNTGLSDFVQTKKRFKIFLGYLDRDDIGPLSIILPKIIGYVKTFDKTKLMSFCITEKWRFKRRWFNSFAY